MLVTLFGANCAGKTTALYDVRAREIGSLAIHDHDEIGVPLAPDTEWRQRTTEATCTRGSTANEPESS